MPIEDTFGQRSESGTGSSGSTCISARSASSGSTPSRETRSSRSFMLVVLRHPRPVEDLFADRVELAAASSFTVSAMDEERKQERFVVGLDDPDDVRVKMRDALAKAEAAETELAGNRGATRQGRALAGAGRRSSPRNYLPSRPPRTANRRGRPVLLAPRIGPRRARSGWSSVWSTASFARSARRRWRDPCARGPQPHRWCRAELSLLRRAPCEVDSRRAGPRHVRAPRLQGRRALRLDARGWTGGLDVVLTGRRWSVPGVPGGWRR